MIDDSRSDWRPNNTETTPMISRRDALAAGAAMIAGSLRTTRVHAGFNKSAGDGRICLTSGRTLGYHEYGHNDGPLVFYFHGTPGSRLELGLCDDETCNAGKRLIGVDRPGIGLSSYDGCRRILDWPHDIEQLADVLGSVGQSFGVVGMSGGAPYAAACALKIPHRLTHVAIVSGHAPPGAPGTCPGNQDKLIATVTRRPRLSRVAFRFIDRRLDRRPDKVIERITRNLSAADRQAVLCDPALYRQVQANLNEATRCGPAGLVTDVRLLGCDWGFRLNDIQGVPVSIWQGGCDPVVTPSMACYFHQQIAGSELTIDPCAGHITMLKWHSAEILARFPV